MNKSVLVYFIIGLLLTQVAAAKIVDLTHDFDEKTIYWPTEKGYKRETVFFGKTNKNYFYSAFKFCAPEHGGTHIDAPIHFSEKGLSVDQIPIDQLLGQAVIIDVSKQVGSNRDYLITKDDILSFENKYRKLTSDDIVIFRTNWSQYWDDKKKYLGTDVLGDIEHLHFPGIAASAAMYLLQQQVKGLGIDSASMDNGQAKDFLVHRIILGANKYGLENLSNLGVLPPTGARIIVAPMKIKGGSGAPVRVFALID